MRWPVSYQEEKVLHKLLDLVRYMKPASAFETYLSRLQASGMTGVPTTDEAKKDYLSRDGFALRR